MAQHAMINTSILSPNGILVIAVPPSALPAFFSDETRPAYVPRTVKAIFPAHLETERGPHHHCIVEFGSSLSEMFDRIAEQYAAQVEQEAHELSRLDEMSYMGYAENHAV